MGTGKGVRSWRRIKEEIREMKSRDENGGARRQPGEKRGGENEQE